LEPSALRYLRPAAAVVLFIGLLWLLKSLDIASYVAPAELKRLMARTEPYEPLVFIGLCVACIFLHLPVIFLVALGGAFFGVALGFLYGWLGCIIGSISTFLLVRYVAKEAFQQKVSTRFAWLSNLDATFAKHGFQTILLLRIFLFMAPPLNWVIGVSHLQLRHYIVGTMLGITPLLGISTYFGSLIEEAQTIMVLVEPRILLPGFLLLVLVAGGGLLGSRYLSKTTQVS
jgi:phospholipase D1/2